MSLHIFLVGVGKSRQVPGNQRVASWTVLGSMDLLISWHSWCLRKQAGGLGPTFPVHGRFLDRMPIRMDLSEDASTPVAAHNISVGNVRRAGTLF